LSLKRGSQYADRKKKNRGGGTAGDPISRKKKRGRGEKRRTRKAGQRDRNSGLKGLSSISREGGLIQITRIRGGSGYRQIQVAEKED